MSKPVETGVVICRTCGRVVERTSNVGRIPEGHSICNDAQSRIEQLKRHFSEIEFASPEMVRQCRGQIMSILNGPLHAANVRIIQESDEARETDSSREMAGVVGCE